MSSHDKPLDIFWFIPVSGDGSYLGTDKGNRPADFSYLKQIAQAADRLGFGGALIPVGAHCEDPWIVAAALAPADRATAFPRRAAAGRWRRRRISRARPPRSTASATAASSSIWSPAATPRSWRATAYFSTTTSATRRRPSSCTCSTGCSPARRVDYAGRYVKVEGARQLFPPVQTHDRRSGSAARPTPAHRSRRRAERRLSDLGRAAGAGGREDRRGAPPRRAEGPRGEVRPAHPSHRARDRGPRPGRVADKLIANVSDEAIAAAQTKVRRGVRFGRPEAHERAARRRQARQAR